MSVDSAFQELIPGNHCWGCGPLNEHGLHVRSYWEGEESVCTWTPSPWHAAGPTHVVNGEIIATILDCHTVCTAMADAYRKEGRAMDSPPLIWYVTANLDVTYTHPAPIAGPLHLRACVEETSGRKSVVTGTLSAGGVECARVRTLAIRVSSEWHEGSGG